MPCEVKQHPNSPYDFILVNWLGHLMGPISISPELKCRVRPLLARMDPVEREVRCHNNSIKPSAIYQPQELPYLLHSVRVGPLQPLCVRHWHLINVTLDIWLHLLDVEPSIGLVLHIHVKRDGDVLTHHPIPQL